MQSKKTVLIAQIFITFMMALSMSGLMGLFAMGPTIEWLLTWPKHFIIAWPIAFILTQFTTPLAFRAAGKLTAQN